MALPYNILLVDDDLNLLESLGDILEQRGYQVFKVASGEKALKFLNEGQEIHLAMIDLKLPGMDGIGLLEHLRSDFEHTAVIMLTGYGSIGNAVKAMKMGARDYLEKPVNPEELLLIVSRECQHRQLLDQNVYFMRELSNRYRIENIVGRSPVMLEVYQKIKGVADSTASVLIVGESGTGKELVANHIHYFSARQKEPFVTVSCAALSPGVLESELFGHVKGAFTNANSDRMGRFEQAHSGTLFLDEVGDIPQELQTKLLRVLQSQEFERVGGNQKIHSDFRLISATHHDLRTDITKGTFREDLLYRLNVVEITLPPLRTRKEDIPDLVNHFIDIFARKTNKPINSISEKALTTLCAHHWPGNVRELKNVIEHAFVYCQELVISVNHLPTHLLNSSECGQIDLKKNPIRSLEKLERAAVELCLHETGGNISQSARRLGISRNTLISKMKKLGLIRGIPPPKN